MVSSARIWSSGFWPRSRCPSAVPLALDRSLFARVGRLRPGTRRAVAGDLLGAYRTRVKGHGLEYRESRPYERGDDVRHIDWKVMARTGEAYTKLFDEERRLRLAIYLDLSASMRFGGVRRSKLELAADAAATIALAAVRGGDVVEVAGFGEQILWREGPIARERAFWRLVHRLESLDDSPYAQAGTVASFAAVAQDLARHRRRPEVVVLLSDFADAPQEAAIDRAVALHSDVLPVQIVSRLELTPPRGVRPAWWDAESRRAAASTGADDLTMWWGRRVTRIVDDEDAIVALARVLGKGRG